MKKIYVLDLESGNDIEDFFMIKSFALKTTNNNKKYFDFTIGDKTGEINAKLWDAPEENSPYEEGQIIKIKGLVSEWNGTNQIKIMKIRTSTDDDQCHLKDYIEAAPEAPEEMYDYIFKKAENIKDDQLRKITLELLKKQEKELMYYPAAMKNHHSIMGGLLYHIKRMLMLAENMCLVYTNLRKDYLICGVILHDIAKIYEMQSNELGIVSEYTAEGYLLGHIVQGIKMVEKTGEALGINQEKLLMIEHMILSHHNEPEFGSPKRPMFPEAEMLHYLDQIDARIYDMEEALNNTKPGTFSDKVWTLHNRKLYKMNNE